MLAKPIHSPSIGQFNRGNLQKGYFNSLLGSDEAPHIDHIVALANGGGSDVKDLRLMCANCNLGKGASNALVANRSLGRTLAPFERLMGAKHALPKTCWPR